jgi:heat shock protein HslJ
MTGLKQVRGVRRSAFAVLVLAALVLAVAGCGGSGSDHTASSVTNPAGPPLQGKQWILSDRSDLGVPLAGVSVTARFADGQVTGSSGCNAYHAPFQSVGSALTVGPDIAGTRKACEPGPTAVEHAYLSRLPEVETYTIEGKELILINGSGVTLLIYEESGGAAAIVANWTATSYYTGNAVQSVIVGSKLTADFGTDQISGDSGCNTFSGPYTATGTTIKIGPLSSTLKACADPARQTQEQQYTAALGLATTYRITGNQLQLFRAGGGIAATFDKS